MGGGVAGWGVAGWGCVNPSGVIVINRSCQGTFESVIAENISVWELQTVCQGVSLGSSVASVFRPASTLNPRESMKAKKLLKGKQHPATCFRKSESVIVCIPVSSPPEPTCEAPATR